jgi:hypothetical protein
MSTTDGLNGRIAIVTGRLRTGSTYPVHGGWSVEGNC